MYIPYGMSTYIGLAGAGKTSLLSKFVFDFTHNKENIGRNCYTNVPVRGAKKIEISDIGNYLIQDGFVGLDEMGINQYNRNWKTNVLSQEMLNAVKTYRHYEISHYCLFSQALDFDNLWIRMSDSLHILRKFGCFTLVMNFHQAFLGFSPVDGKPIFSWAPDWFIYKYDLVLRSKYYDLFNTLDRKELPIKYFPEWNDISTFRINVPPVLNTIDIIDRVDKLPHYFYKKYFDFSYYESIGYLNNNIF